MGNLDPEIPARVITHSRGATVITAALWNVEPVLDTDFNREYRIAQTLVPTPKLPRVRLGLLAPSIGGIEFRNNDSGSPTLPINGIVLGINRDDYALGKGPVPASWFGDTSLGCEPEVFEEYVASAPDASWVDFSNNEEHNFTVYLMRRVFEEQFLPRLMKMETTAPLTTAGNR